MQCFSGLLLCWKSYFWMYPASKWCVSNGFYIGHCRLSVTGGTTTNAMGTVLVTPKKHVELSHQQCCSLSAIREQNLRVLGAALLYLALKRSIALLRVVAGILHWAWSYLHQPYGGAELSGCCFQLGIPVASASSQQSPLYCCMHNVAC